MSEELGLDDFKQMRVGWIDQGRLCDEIVKAAVAALPGDNTLPPRWAWKTHDKFMDKYGGLGRILWAKTASYHLLVINGWHIIRIWTDSPRTCIVDLSDPVATFLRGQNYSGSFHPKVEVVPESCARKCHPLTQRVRIQTVPDMQQVMSTIRSTYGI